MTLLIDELLLPSSCVVLLHIWQIDYILQNSNMSQGFYLRDGKLTGADGNAFMGISFGESLLLLTSRVLDGGDGGGIII